MTAAMMEVDMGTVIIAVVIAGIVYSLVEYLEGVIRLRKRAEDRLKQDKNTIGEIWMSEEPPRFEYNEIFWGLDEYYEDEKKLKSDERRRVGRYSKESHLPIDQAPLKDFLLPEERHVLSGFLLNRDCSHADVEEFLDRKIERWDLFAKFINHRRYLLSLSMTKEQPSVEDKVQEIVSMVIEMGRKKSS